jgi:hypothetical protein
MVRKLYEKERRLSRDYFSFLEGKIELVKGGEVGGSPVHVRRESPGTGNSVAFFISDYPIISRASPVRQDIFRFF